MKKLLIGLTLLTSMSSFASYNCEMHCMIANKEPVFSGMRVLNYFKVNSNIESVYSEGQTRNQAYQNAISQCRDMGGNFIVHSYQTGHLKVGMMQLPGQYLIDYSDPTPRNSCQKD